MAARDSQLWCVLDPTEVEETRIQASDTGGIPVRQEKSKKSTIFDEPLKYNAVVKEIEFIPYQLHYELLDGTGPRTGWVEIAPQGMIQVIRIPKRKMESSSGQTLPVTKVMPQNKPAATPACGTVGRKSGGFSRTLLPLPIQKEQRMELQGIVKQQPGGIHQDSSPEEFLEDLSMRDESGFVMDDKDPMHYVCEEELERSDGEDHVVVYNRIAVRRSPNLEGKVVGMKEKGDHLDLFEWDKTHEWRSVHFTLCGGWGSIVKAWVLINHPKLGPLMKPTIKTPLTTNEANAVDKDGPPNLNQKGDICPLEEISPVEPGGEEYEVVEKRIAIRIAPSPNGDILGACVKGQRLHLFEWDTGKAFRRMKYVTQGGWGEIVDAWVMVEHPKLGTLLRSVSEKATGNIVCSSCGKFEEGTGDTGICKNCSRT